MADPTPIATLSDLDALTSANKTVVLDFWAEWCPPCKAIAPLYGKLAREYAVPGKLAFGKVDVDSAPEVAQRFGVSAMPTFLFLVDGQASGVDVGGKAPGGGGVVFAEGEGVEGRVRMIRGADPRNLVAVVAELGRLAKEEEKGTEEGATEVSFAPSSTCLELGVLHGNVDHHA